MLFLNMRESLVYSLPELMMNWRHLACNQRNTRVKNMRKLIMNFILLSQKNYKLMLFLFKESILKTWVKYINLRKFLKFIFYFFNSKNFQFESSLKDNELIENF